MKSLILVWEKWPDLLPRAEFIFEKLFQFINLQRDMLLLFLLCFPTWDKDDNKLHEFSTIKFQWGWLTGNFCVKVKDSFPGRMWRYRECSKFYCLQQTVRLAQHPMKDTHHHRLCIRKKHIPQQEQWAIRIEEYEAASVKENILGGLNHYCSCIWQKITPHTCTSSVKWSVVSICVYIRICLSKKKRQKSHWKNNNLILHQGNIYVAVTGVRKRTLFHFK